MRHNPASAQSSSCSGALGYKAWHRPYRRADDGSRARADDHPAERLVSGFSNGWTAASDLRRAQMFEAVNRGISYASISKVRGTPPEIIPLPRSAVKHEVDEASGEPNYAVSLRGGGTRRYSFGDILKIRPWDGRSLTATLPKRSPAPRS